MSSTAAGSRITVYFPAGISAGCAESIAFSAAISASAQRIEIGHIGRVGLLPSRGIRAQHGDGNFRQASAYASWLRPRELKMPSTDSELEKMPAVVSLCFCATSTIFFTRVGAKLAE